MEKIDELFINNKINFEDYVFAQFNNAKEYEQIIIVLSKYPEYKSKIKTYTIAYSKKQQAEEKKYSKEEVIFNRNINWLYELLYPHVKYYTRDEIFQGILDQGYDNEIANVVVSKLEKDGTPFSTQIYYPESKTASFINKLFGYRDSNDNDVQSKDEKLENVQNKPKEISTQEKSTFDQPKETKQLEKTDSPKITKTTFEEDKIDISKFGQNQRHVFDEEKADINKFKFIEEKEKEKRKSLLSKIFQKKQKKPTVDQINDIFKDIQKHINK